MASSFTHLCTLCQEDDASTEAVSWCLECEDLLCTDCEKHHGKSKASKQHKTITVADYESLPPSVLKISNKCIQHHDRFERFCSFHEIPCCIQCISQTHKECKLSPLVEILQNVKESSALFHLERDLNEIKENLGIIEKHISDRIAKVNDQKKHCLNEIKRVRTTVNEHLDTIERNILDELSQNEKDIKKTIESLASQIESKKRRVINLQDSLLKTKQYATDLQIFLSIKEMEKQTSEDAKYVEDLENGDAMVDKSLQLEVSTALESLQREVIEFGKISVNSVPSTFKLTRTSQGQARLSLPIVSTLDKVHLVNIATFKLPDTTDVAITACAILPTGECVFTDHENFRLRLYNVKRSQVRNVVQISDPPFDMCYIEDKTVAVTFPTNRTIIFVDVFKNKTVKTIAMRSKCFGIDCHNQKIFVRILDEDVVVVMDVKGKIEQRIDFSVENVTRIACYKNYIYCTNENTSEVLCCSMSGEMVWKRKYDTLVSPLSIAIDKRLGIIYVIDRPSDNLVAISSNGDRSKIVLSKEDGLNQVDAINIGADNKLFVCNFCDKLAFLYQL